MSDLVVGHATPLSVYAPPHAIAPMSDAAIARVHELEEITKTLPQKAIFTDHVIHAGLYARTVMIPAGHMITGARIKRATLLVVNGDALAYVGTETAIELHGYNVIPASANRKQVFVARSDVDLTMIFPTTAKTVEEAEKEFTDEFDDLASHADPSFNRTTITGE